MLFFDLMFLAMFLLPFLVIARNSQNRRMLESNYMNQQRFELTGADQMEITRSVSSALISLDNHIGWAEAEAKLSEETIAEARKNWRNAWECSKILNSGNVNNAVATRAYKNLQNTANLLEISDEELKVLLGRLKGKLEIEPNTGNLVPRSGVQLDEFRRVPQSSLVISPFGLGFALMLGD